ncbi:hypothetical protein XENORESO_006628 [Xenotaenia resolanae]|uniref:Uncharacterized protein n=1 Tax=Xenotaenia resolanae TaxID=208358 RepID=A0ABV0X185_9TELE
MTFSCSVTETTKGRPDWLTEETSKERRRRRRTREVISKRRVGAESTGVLHQPHQEWSLSTQRFQHYGACVLTLQW